MKLFSNRNKTQDEGTSANQRLELLDNWHNKLFKRRL